MPGVLVACLMLLMAAAGCGTSARAPLAHTADSPEALAREVLAAMASQDRERLAELALSEEEFRALVWPQLPTSRPEVGLPIDYAWSDLQTKSRAHLYNTLAAVSGQSFDLLDVRFAGDVTDYETFRVHRESILEVRTASGVVGQVRLFGSMIEHGGRMKVFSYVVD